ncbi:chaperone protein dnaJ [Trifolium pratense]|uniref:Chaperone protein dnaJ n=1 Tax=Trifolium pratense TaxID=57577 RepID=A0A2K3PDI2_TRIPR|nr:chaperone protein dnaJ [Trifolium pratense]
MECNKDEALRAKQIAENRMQSGDFVGALKFARKAQRLFPEIQNITQILTVCEVHCAAQNKLSTSDMDWYGILLTDKFTEEATIKKQYKKLALLLHPDKNRSAGAEAAFKLIVEANRVLSDPTKRSLYNAKISRLVGITASQDERPTFWTSCQHCNTKYQYYRSIVNATVHCQQCSRPFKAHDIGFYVPTEHTSQSFNSHKYPPNHVPPKEASKSNGRKPYGKGPEEKVVPSCPVYMAKCSAGNGASCKVRKSKDGHGAAGVTKAGAGTSNGATSKAKQSQIPTNVGSKRARQPASAEFESASKRPQQDKSFKSVKVEKQEVPGNGGFNNTNPASFTADVVDQNGEIRNKANAQPEKTDLRKQMKSNIDDTKAKAENSQLKSNLPPDDVISCPDPDFSNFDKIKTEDSFADNQFWAIYDDTDCMPRFYAHIKKVHSPFKLEYTWLEPNPNHKDEIDWYDAGLPVACGKYRLGHSQKTRNCGMFSHQVHCTKGSARGSYLVYPMKGETWAIFRHWDIGWSSNPEKNSEYQFEYVEVLSDFDEKDGVKVAYLRKVKGFVSLFQQTVQNGIGIFCIPSKELYRFSHRVPSFTMTGNEREDVPRGSFELDPAGLPMSVTRVEVGDPSDVKMKVEKLNNVVSSCQESSKRKVEQAKSNERVHKAKLRESKCTERVPPIIRRSSRSNVKSMDNGQASTSQNMVREDDKNNSQRDYSQPEGSEAATIQTNKNFKTPKKPEKRNYHGETLTVPRSPIDLRKKIDVGGAGECATGKLTDNHSNTSNNIKETVSSRSVGNDSARLKKDSGVVGACYDFNKEKSREMFQCGQIWAIYGDRDGMPDVYVQIKKIGSTSNLRLHVSELEPCSPPKGLKQTISCGSFKIKKAKLQILSPSAFSHPLKIEPMENSIYEIYPKKGEIWALYKDQNYELTSSNQGRGECYIVEVLAESDKCIQVVVLVRLNGSQPIFKAPIIRRSKTSILEILREEVGRFSHQVHAFQPSGKDDVHLSGCWVVNPSSIPGFSYT